MSTSNLLHMLKNCKQVLPKVIWEELCRHPSRQKMDSPAVCASCAMPTADESSHSAAGMLHPHHTDGHTTMARTALA